jgi:transcription elongation factor
MRPTNIDGFIILDGKSTEISNHLVFNENGDGKVFTTDSRNILRIIKDELNSNLYSLDRRNVEIIDGNLKSDIKLLVEISKDFKYIYASTFKNNYIAPAQNLDEVKSVSNILFFKK